jgi:hypothetical protein
MKSSSVPNDAKVPSDCTSLRHYQMSSFRSPDDAPRLVPSEPDGAGELAVFSLVSGSLRRSTVALDEAGTISLRISTQDGDALPVPEACGPSGMRIQQFQS